MTEGFCSITASISSSLTVARSRPPPGSVETVDWTAPVSPRSDLLAITATIATHATTTTPASVNRLVMRSNRGAPGSGGAGSGSSAAMISAS